MEQKPSLKTRARRYWDKVKTLQGDPRYIARGMAVGVFVGITPTIPFHTVIALALAFLFKGSKPAAAAAVWIANPVTIPFFYIGSFKAGTLLLSKPIPFDVRFESIQELLTLGLDVTVAMVAGGAILGIVPAVAAYILTFRFFTSLRAKVRQEESTSRGR